MQSTAATEPDSKNSNHPNLVACLALYQHRQDQAVGIHWVSDHTRNLLIYYQLLQSEDISRLFSAAYYNGIIQQGAAEIKAITVKAKRTEKKGKLLEQAIHIQGIIKAAKVALDELEAGQK